MLIPVCFITLAPFISRERLTVGIAPVGGLDKPTLRGADVKPPVADFSARIGFQLVLVMERPSAGLENELIGFARVLQSSLKGAAISVADLRYQPTFTGDQRNTASPYFFGMSAYWR